MSPGSNRKDLAPVAIRQVLLVSMLSTRCYLLRIELSDILVASDERKNRYLLPFLQKRPAALLSR